MKRRLGLALVLAAVAAGVFAQAAVAEPAFVLWASGTAPGSRPARGVTLSPGGTGRVLRSDSGGVVDEQQFLPTGPQLAAIRAAASAAFAAGPKVTRGKTSDGSVVSAVIEDGGVRRAVVGVGATGPILEPLVAAVNAALPQQAAIAGAGRSGPFALAAAGPAIPSTAECPQGLEATSFGRRLSLGDAAKAGVVTKLEAKGFVQGDSISVEAKFKDVKAPIVVSVGIEVESLPNDFGEAKDLEAVLNDALKNKKIPSGPLKNTPVEFKFDVRDRAPGAPPSPCYHQVKMVEAGVVRSFVEGSVNGGVAEPLGGVWEADPNVWVHEALHLAGLPDKYKDFFRSDSGKLVPLSGNGLSDEQLTTELAGKGLTPAQGSVVAIPFTGFKNDVMGRYGANGFSAGELLKIAKKSQDTLVVRTKPGDVLVSKQNAAQNMISADKLDIVLKKGEGPVKLDGLIAYCIDRHRSPPAKGVTRFDVLDPATAPSAQPGFQALTRLAEVVARQPITDRSLVSVLGASDAFWRISDDEPLDPNDDDVAESRRLLALAGVPEDPGVLHFGAPKFTTVNAASPAPRGVSPTALLPALNLPKGPKPGALAKLKLTGAQMPQRTLPAEGGRPLETVLVRTSGFGNGKVSLSLEGAFGVRFRTLGALGKAKIGEGETALVVRLPRALTAGAYRVVVTQGKRSVRAAFSVAS
jgi:hypothetical protein